MMIFKRQKGKKAQELQEKPVGKTTRKNGKKQSRK